MPWNARGKSALLAIVVCGASVGCRASVERGEPPPPQTIVVRESSAASAPREYDSGERAPNRIEVVVSEPSGGGGGGPPVLGQLVGRSVKVQFRRDALGLSATSNAPVPITGQGPGGRAVSINGTVRSATGGWLVLEREKVSYWIPQGAILLIETSDPPATAPATE